MLAFKVAPETEETLNGKIAQHCPAGGEKGNPVEEFKTGYNMIST